MNALHRKLIASATLCAAIATPSLSFAALCDPSALGLQAYAGAQYNDAGCLVNNSSTSPVFNAASSSNAQASATTAYGVNSASVSGFLTPAGGTTNASAWSLWKDIVTISGGSGTDVVYLGSHITGSYTARADVNYTLAVNDGALGNFSGFSSRYFAAEDPNLSYDVGFYYTFTYDTPFAVTSWLDLSGYLNSSYCCGETAFSADFTHTVVFDTVNLPAGAVLTTSSGVSYPMQLTTVPVPGAAWLLGSGLLGLIGMSGKRHRG